MDAAVPRRRDPAGLLRPSLPNLTAEGLHAHRAAGKGTTPREEGRTHCATEWRPQTAGRPEEPTEQPPRDKGKPRNHPPEDAQETKNTTSGPEKARSARRKNHLQQTLPRAAAMAFEGDLVAVQVHVGR